MVVSSFRLPTDTARRLGKRLKNLTRPQTRLQIHLLVRLIRAKDVFNRPAVLVIGHNDAHNIAAARGCVLWEVAGREGSPFMRVDFRGSDNADDSSGRP